MEQKTTVTVSAKATFGELMGSLMKTTKIYDLSYELLELLISWQSLNQNNGPVQLTVRITPEVARKIIALRNNTKSDPNRTKRPYGIAKYKDAMEKGKWVLSDPISFNRNGFLENGQHRLTAAIQANKTLTTTIQIGVDHNISLDRPIMRTVCDNGKMANGMTYDRMYVAAINNMHRIYTETHTSISDIKVLAAYDAARDTITALYDSIPFQQNNIRLNAPLVSAILTASLMGYGTVDQISEMITMIREGKFVKDNDIFLQPLRDDMLRRTGAFDRRKASSEISMAQKTTVEYLRYFIPYLKGKNRKIPVDQSIKTVKDAFAKIAEAA